MSRTPLLEIDLSLAPGPRQTATFPIRLPERDASAILVHARGQLHAWLNHCPHFGVPLDEATPGRFFDSRRSKLVCQRHGARFQPYDGLCVHGPCKGDRLERLELVEFFGQLQIYLPERLAVERPRTGPSG